MAPASTAATSPGLLASPPLCLILVVIFLFFALWRRRGSGVAVGVGCFGRGGFGGGGGGGCRGGREAVQRGAPRRRSILERNYNYEVKHYTCATMEDILTPTGDSPPSSRVSTRNFFPSSSTSMMLPFSRCRRYRRPMRFCRRRRSSVT